VKRRQLAQLKPSGTSAEALFNPTENKVYLIDLILCTNSSGASVDVTIYHDADGSTYDSTTEIFATSTLDSGTTLEFAPTNGISHYLAAGNVAVKTSTGGSVNFTAYGYIEGERF